MTTKFEAAKLKRELKMSGINYEFKRLKVNDFGEPIPGVNEVVATIKGLYHEQNSNIQITTGDTTQVRTKKIPMVLCLYDDAALAALKVGDVVKINSKTFKMTGVVNIQEWSIIADISLEVVDNGVQN
jgi:Cu/Ag efflux protein CusF